MMRFRFRRLLKNCCVFSLVFLFLGGNAGCPDSGGTGGSSNSGSSGTVTHRETNVSGKLAVALGGTAPGADEIVISEVFTTLDLQNNDPDLFDLKPRSGSLTFAGGKGARVIPLKSGIGYVTPVVNGRSESPIEVTIPPQSLIQILIGEARGELAREATRDGSSVKATSVSVTGDAVGAVIRNRINLINAEDSPSLFSAKAEDYTRDPPVSSYDAVIEANEGTVFQFSPVEPGDPSHGAYLDAALRSDVDQSLLISYDQAVITAAAVFNGDTKDPTSGAFAFYSPTSAENEVLKEALQSGTQDLPQGAGTSDANFPALAPVQVLLLTEIAPSTVGGGVPSFVFVRSKKPFDVAVSEEP